MSEEVSVSAATPEAAPPVGDSAGTSSATAPTPEVAAQPADAGAQQQQAEAGLDLGWSLDLEEGASPEAQAAELPETDDDLQPPDGGQLPTVEQLVSSVRFAREQAREAKRQLRELRAQSETSAAVPEGAADLRQAFLYDADGQPGTPAFLQQLYDMSPARYSQAVDAIVEHHADYVLGKLQEKGLVPADAQPQPASAEVDADVLAEIPEALRETFKALPPSVREELALMSPEARDYNLEREARLQQLDAAQQRQAREAWDAKVQSAARQGQTDIEQLAGQYQKAIDAQLAKFTPYGPDDPRNAEVWGEMKEGAWAAVLADPKFLQMHADTIRLLSNSHLRALNGEAAQAEDDRRKARDYALQLNTRFGQVLGARLKARNEVYRKARLYDEMTAQGGPSRKEIPGPGAHGPSSGPRISPVQNGRLTSEYLDDLARRHAGQ
jgi:hypothetical protein